MRESPRYTLALFSSDDAPHVQTNVLAQVEPQSVSGGGDDGPSSKLPGLPV